MNVGWCNKRWMDGPGEQQLCDGALCKDAEIGRARTMSVFSRAGTGSTAPIGPTVVLSTGD